MKHYFLFTDADGIAAINKGGVRKFNKEYECGNITGYATFCFTDGITTPEDLLQEFQGWGDYVCLTEKEYNKL